MLEKIYFYYAGKYSKDFGLVVLNQGDKLFEETFLPNVKINETKIRGRDKPYFHGVERDPISFPLRIAFLNGFDERTLGEVAMWLFRDHYAEFYMVGLEHRRYFCMPVEDSKILHNGIKQGYFDITMRCDDIYAYSPEYLSKNYDFSINPFVYKEDTQTDFQSGTISPDISINADGSMSLKKEGVDYSNVVDTNAEWNLGTHDKTQSLNNKLEIQYEIQPGTDFNKTETTSSDWGDPNATLSSVDGTSGDLKLAKEGTDFLGYADSTTDWSGGTHANTEAVDPGQLQLAWQITPGTNFNKTETTQTDWKDPSASLSGVDADSSVGNIVLAKEGTNYSKTDTLNADFSGTHSNTQAITDTIQLTKSGTDFTKRYDIQSDWNNASNTLSNTTGDASGNLILSNLPAWDYSDNMSSWTTNWTSYDPSTTSLISQQSGYVHINVTSAQSTHTGICLSNSNINFPMTVDFRAKGSGTCRIILENGSNYIYCTVPVTGTWSWYRVRFVNTTTMYLYKDGVQQSITPTSNPSTAQRLMFFVPNTFTGTFDIDQVYIDYGYDKGAPPANNQYLGTWTSGSLSLSTVKLALSSLVTFTSSFSGDPSDYTVLFESQLTVSGTPQGWNTLTNNNSIPGITKGNDLSSTSVQFRITLTSKDPGRSPTVDYLQANVNTGYNTSGTYTSPSYNISSVGKAASSIISWTSTLPANTNITVQVSVNGGAFQNATSGSTIPGVTQSTALSTIQYKVNLSTTDVAVTPSFNDITFSLTSGYKTSGNRISPAFDISGTHKVVNSNISWTNSIPTNTSVTVETRISTDGGSTWSSWSTATSGQAIPGLAAGTITTNYRLQYRVTLSTTDTSQTPVFNDATLLITATLGERYTSGNRVSDPINISQVGKAGRTTFSWIANVPNGTTVTAETSLSTDGGSTWSTWQQVTNGGSIPQITQSTDLTNARLKYRFTLTTGTGTTVTPYVDRVDYQLFSGYKTSGYRISPAFDISTVNKVVKSAISWTKTLQPNTGVAFQTRIGTDNSGTITWGSWTDLKLNLVANHQMNVDSDANGVVDGFISNYDPTLTCKFSLDSNSQLIYVNQSTGSGVASVKQQVDVVAGRTYSVSVDGKAALVVGGFAGRITILWLDSTGAVISSSSSSTFTQTTFKRIKAENLTAPTGAVKAEIRLEARVGTAGDSGKVWFKNLLFEESTTASEYTPYGFCIIPGLGETTLTTNLRMQYKVTLTTSDTNNTPSVQDVTLFVDATPGERYLQATYTSNVFDISQVVKAGRATISWTEEKVSGDHIIVQTSLSLDGGMSWGEWSKVDNGEEIYGIEQSTDLTNARVKFKVLFFKDNDDEKTPRISNMSLDLISGYKPEATRTTNSIDLFNGKVYGTSISWIENKPEGTDIIIEISKDGGQTWNKVTNGGDIVVIQDGDDVTDTNLMIRETLKAYDTSKTPTLYSLNVAINKGVTIENIGHVEIKPEMWIKKVGDGDVTIKNRDNGIVFTFTGLKDGETIYIDNEDKYIETDIPGTYRYGNFNKGWLVIERGINDLEISGNCYIQFRYRMKLLQG